MKQTLLKAMKKLGKEMVAFLYQTLATAIGTFILGKFCKGFKNFKAKRTEMKSNPVDVTATETDALDNPVVEEESATETETETETDTNIDED